jgi:hypothetical protein
VLRAAGRAGIRYEMGSSAPLVYVDSTEPVATRISS